MHFHFPKPLHGWRAPLVEGGVVLLGVLLALRAHQLMDAPTNRKATQRSQRGAPSLESVSSAENNLDAVRLGFLKHDTWSPE